MGSRWYNFGPPSFPAYARLRFLPDPAYEGQSENDVDDDAPAWALDLEEDTTPAERLLSSAPHRESMPGVQDRYGDPPSAAHAPKVVIPNRAYYLFHGAASELGDWGAARTRPDQHADVPAPAFIWPADHAWCVANDVDPHWAGIGADTAAIDQLLADPLFDVVPADPREEQPGYR